MDKIKTETGKGFFTDNFNPKSGEYEGVEYSIAEVNAIAKKYGIEAKEESGIHWANCAEVTEEEAAVYALGKLESGHGLVPVEKSKLVRSLKHASRLPSNEKGKKVKSKVKKALKASATKAQ